MIYFEADFTVILMFDILRIRELANSRIREFENFEDEFLVQTKVLS